MRQRADFLTEELVTKISLICQQRPDAAYYQPHHNTLTILEVESFAESIKDIDQRSLPVFLKRLQAVGFHLLPGSDSIIYQWRPRRAFNLSREINTLTDTLSSSIARGRVFQESISQRKEYVECVLQKMIFELLIKGGEGEVETVKRVQCVIGEIQGILAATVKESVKGMDEVERVEEQEIFIYRNLISKEGASGY